MSVEQQPTHLAPLRSDIFELLDMRELVEVNHADVVGDRNSYLQE